MRTTKILDKSSLMNKIQAHESELVNLVQGIYMKSRQIKAVK